MFHALGLIVLLAHSALAIIGGNDADELQFPYLVGVADPFGQLYCSGSILNDRWILTCAQCVDGDLPSSVKVHVGSTRIAAGARYDISNIM